MLYAPPFPTDAAASSEAAAPLSSWIKSLGQRIGAWAATCADYYSAAAVYDDLRRLSNAELQHRGLSRDSLARDVCQACDRAAGH